MNECKCNDKSCACTIDDHSCCSCEPQIDEQSGTPKMLIHGCTEDCLKPNKYCELNKQLWECPHGMVGTEGASCPSCQEGFKCSDCGLKTDNCSCPCMCNFRNEHRHFSQRICPHCEPKFKYCDGNHDSKLCSQDNNPNPKDQPIESNEEKCKECQRIESIYGKNYSCVSCSKEEKTSKGERFAHDVLKEIMSWDENKRNWLVRELTQPQPSVNSGEVEKCCCQGERKSDECYLGWCKHSCERCSIENEETCSCTGPKGTCSKCQLPQKAEDREWEKEFDQQFDFSIVLGQNSESEKNLKTFIRNLLQSRESQIKESERKEFLKLMRNALRHYGNTYAAFEEVEHQILNNNSPL